MAISKNKSAALVVPLLELLIGLQRLVPQHHLVGPVPQHPVLHTLRAAYPQQGLQHLLEELLDGLGVLEVELAEEDLVLVGQHLAEVLHHPVPALLAGVVEDDVDGLGGDLLEVELGPDGVLELSEPLLRMGRGTSSR